MPAGGLGGRDGIGAAAAAAAVVVVVVVVAVSAAVVAGQLPGALMELPPVMDNRARAAMVVGPTAVNGARLPTPP